MGASNPKATSSSKSHLSFLNLLEHEKAGAYHSAFNAIHRTVLGIQPQTLPSYLNLLLFGLLNLRQFWILRGPNGLLGVTAETDQA